MTKFSIKYQERQKKISKKEVKS